MQLSADAGSNVFKGFNKLWENMEIIVEAQEINQWENSIAHICLK